MGKDKVRLVLKTDFSTKFHKFGFWILTALLVGFFLGGMNADRIIDKRLADSVTYKVIKIDGREYSLQERF